MRLLKPDGLLWKKLRRWANDAEVLGQFQRPYGWGARKLSGDETHAWIIANRQRHVGFCYVQQQRFGITEIGVTILAQYRGQGLGKRAHALLLRTARFPATRAFQAITAGANAAERRILEMLGFYIADEILLEDIPHLLVYRRAVRPASINHLVVVVMGPAGVGKSSLCSALKPLLRDSAELNGSVILSIWGDMFSHLSYPWVADEVQLARKYRAMTGVLRDLLGEKERSIILIDDLIRSAKDLMAIRDCVETRGGVCLVLNLEADDLQLLHRNTERYQTEILPDETVRALSEQTRRIAVDSSGYISIRTIDNRRPLAEVAEQMRSVIVESYCRNSSTSSRIGHRSVF